MPPHLRSGHVAVKRELKFPERTCSALLRTTEWASAGMRMWLVTCRIAGDGSTAQDATGYRHSCHVQKIDEVGEAAKVGVLGPCHAGCQRLFCFNLCINRLNCIVRHFLKDEVQAISEHLLCLYIHHRVALREKLALCNGAAKGFNALALTSSRVPAHINTWKAGVSTHLQCCSGTQQWGQGVYRFGPSLAQPGALDHSVL